MNLFSIIRREKNVFEGYVEVQIQGEDPLDYDDNPLRNGAVVFWVNGHPELEIRDYRPGVVQAVQKQMSGEKILSEIERPAFLTVIRQKDGYGYLYELREAESIWSDPLQYVFNVTRGDDGLPTYRFKHTIARRKDGILTYVVVVKK